jgi:hypothetical protein
VKIAVVGDCESVHLNEASDFSKMTRSDSRTRPSATASITSPTPWLPKRAAIMPNSPAHSAPSGGSSRRYCVGRLRIAATTSRAPL